MTESSELYETIPSEITTPDVVETRIGTLEFFDGLPTAETAAKAFDNLDFLRGVEAFLNGIPAASIEAMRRGMVGLGVDSSNKVALMDRLMDSNSLFLTGNTDTVYASGILDLEVDGPTVVEIPPGCGPGTVNDAWFRFVIDMGAPGPDRGQGGKYLILPPDYDGPEPDGYFIARSPSYTNWLILRGFLVDGKPGSAAELFRTGLKIYPLSAKDNPPKMEFISGSGVKLNTIHANDFTFYEELATVIHKEPIGVIDPVTSGLLASLGIYGVISYGVSQRTQEIGVRMALGAPASQVSNMIVKQGAIVAGIGLVAGFVAALGLTRLMEALLFEVKPTDPPTFGLVVALLLVVSLLASWIPARRAASVDPMVALRAE